jgi:hypothetical protein
VDELKNHLSVLDGIISPLYLSDDSALRPAERRMLRYLIAEIGNVFDELGNITLPTQDPMGSNAKSRVAI